ncbi:MAG: hypothetical protein BRD23_03815 [Halobacteriales archaeon SW_9_67_25]|nr:MAG: hypothetical protein BRD23_03815 [Halobacteriales archaeon SW_9_67_25]
MTDDREGETPAAGTEPAGIEALFEGLSEVSAAATSTAVSEEVRETKALLAVAHDRGLIESDVRQLSPDDAVQAFAGSVIFASPLLVEDGVFDIADHLVGATVRGVPVFLVANVAFVVVMTYALIEWTGRGLVPTRGEPGPCHPPLDGRVLGAALGDVLSGESSGDDINDDLDQIGDRVGGFVD